MTNTKFHDLLHKAFHNPPRSLVSLSREIAESASAILNPITRPYEQMLADDVLPPDIVASYIAEHIEQIEKSTAGDDAKAQAIHTLQEFAATKLCIAIDEAANHPKLGTTFIHHDKPSGKFAGHIAGKSFRPMTEKGLQSHLVTKHAYHPVAAARLIQQAKSGEGGGLQSRAAEALSLSAHHIHAATTSTGPMRTMHLNAAHDHLTMAHTHMSKEHKSAGFVHPDLNKLANDLSHRLTVHSFVSRLKAKPVGQAQPHERVHISNDHSDTILGPHKEGHGREIVWRLERGK